MFRNSLAITILVTACAVLASAQEQGATASPVIVRPGAPGEATKRLSSDTRATLPPLSQKDIEFMQGMIMHHAQAVEMVALIKSRTTNPDVRRLGARIGYSQAEEMQFMERWLRMRGASPEMDMPRSTNDSHSHGHHTAGHASHGAAMPGMLSEKQMQALRSAKGAEFDRLFLQGMIQHHEGALRMVDDLFRSPGTGQDGEIFSFATDVDTGQRAEIRAMQELLKPMAKPL